MHRVIKEYLPEIDYSSFMLAIVLARHKVDESNVNQQLSAEELSVKMNNLPRGNTANFGVDSVALKHAMNIFSAGLRRRSVSRIVMFHREKSLAPFFSLEGHLRSTEVKFSSYFSPPTRDVIELLFAIREIRDDLLIRSNYPPSVHCSAAAVLGSLHFKPFKNSLNVETVIVKKRKSPDKLSQRMIDINRNKLINEVDNSFEEKHSIFYLESALKRAKKRRKKEVDEDNNNNAVDENGIINDEFDHINHLAVNEMCNDVRVKDALSNLPAKNVKFDADDKKNVLLLYDVVKKIVEERDYTNIVGVSADITEELLESKKYFSTISARAIILWSCAKIENTENKKPGRKVNSDFEADVWGNLMLCVLFEKNEYEVVSYKIK